MRLPLGGSCRTGGKIWVSAMRKVRTKTCPLLCTGENAHCGLGLAAVGFDAFSRGIKERRFLSQPLQKVRTQTCPLFVGKRVWHDGQRCPRSSKTFWRVRRHQAAPSMSTTGCLSGPREANE